MPDDSKQTNGLQLKPGTFQKIKALAASRGDSVNDVASELVESALKHPHARKPHPTPSSANALVQTAIKAINTVTNECRSPNWDGYGAQPVTDATTTAGLRFAMSLPSDVPTPSVGAEPDGSLTFEWHRSASRILSISIASDGVLHYAAILGASRRYGSEPFIDELPQAILELIDEVESVYQTGAA